MGPDRPSPGLAPSPSVLDDLVIGMAGSGGDGIVSAGESLIGAAAEEGYFAVLTKSFGSQIRGGESSVRLRVSTRPVLNPGGELDVAVALNRDDFMRFESEMPVGPRTAVIYDSKTGVLPADIPLKGIRPELISAVAISDLAMAAAGTPQAKNNVVLGLLSGWYGLARKGILDGIRKRFSRKGEEVLRGNEKAFEAGFNHARSNPIAGLTTLGRSAHFEGKRVIRDGNEMCAAGALHAGCRFFGGYPITPATEIMQILQKEIWKHGGSILQAEDEIAGVGAAVGASFAGLKSMTATSGPGFSLKTEMLGLASVVELPLVCINVQRGGPSTGMPTKPEQADLLAAAFSAHGDTVRPVLAPTGVTDIFGVTVEAFNIAEEFQTPVVVLSDQQIAQQKEVIEPADHSGMRLVNRLEPSEEDLKSYARFRLTRSGVSPISRPGMRGGAYLAAGIEHDESGSPNIDGQIHARMNDKRLHKLDPLKERRDLFHVEGDAGATLGIISWGSVAGVAMEAVRAAREEGIVVKLLVPKLLYPVAEEVYESFFESLERCLVVEQSHQGQLYRVIRMWVDVPGNFESLSKSGANLISPREILERIRELA
jgi:2-oxoglutarate/2-oxoacid ferredoxin oxidoreductase subunit alpha